MRRLPVLVFAALALVLVAGALPVSAQDIYGLNFRPTDAAPANAARGSLDIVVGDTKDTFVVTVDLAPAAKSLKLAGFAGAEGFVVWAVDMDGNRHNLGPLSDTLELADAEADFLIAKVFLTAEADVAADQPTGERLYEVTLRNVAEVESTAAGASAAPAKAVKAEPTTAQAAPTAKPAEATAKVAPTTAPTAAAEAKPNVLPPTGGNTRDLGVLLAVVAVLLLGALRVRTIRV